MKLKLIAAMAVTSLAALFNPVSASATSTATVVAADSFRSVSNIGSNSMMETATDAAGNVYFLGQSNNEIVDMAGNTTQVFNFQNSQTDNMILSKYNASGVKQWTQDIGSTSNESAASLAVSPSGKIAIGGRLCMNLVIAPSIFIGPISQFCDGFFAVLDTDGNGLYAKPIGEANAFDPNQWVTNVAFDAAENLYVAAYVSSMSDLAAAGIGGVTFTMPGQTDYSGTVVVKYTSAGAVSWIKPLPRSANLSGQAFAAVNGDVYAGGNFSLATQFDSLGLFTPTAGDGFALRISGATRQIDQLKVVGGAGAQVVSGFRLTSSGEWVVLSRIAGTAVVNSVNYASLGSNDALITKFSGAGLVTDWARQIGSAGNEFFDGLAIDTDSRIYLAGAISTALNLGQVGTFTSSNSGSTNGLLIALEPDGVIAWAKQTTSPSNGFSSLTGGVSVSGNSVYAAGVAAGNQTTIDGVNVSGSPFNCCNGYSSAIWIKVTTSPLGGAVVVNNVSQSQANVIDVTKATPRVIDSPAAAFQQTVSGRNLEKVTSISIAGKQVKFELTKSGELAVEIPELSLGAHNLVLSGTGFHYTLVSAIRVRDVQKVTVNRFGNLKETRAVSKKVREIQNQIGDSHQVSCQLELSTALRVTEARRQVKLAQSFCSSLTVPSKLVVKSGATKTQLSVVVRQN